MPCDTEKFYSRLFGPKLDRFKNFAIAEHIFLFWRVEILAVNIILAILLRIFRGKQDVLRDRVSELVGHNYPCSLDP